MSQLNVCVSTFDMLAFDPKQMKKALRAAGGEIAALARRNIQKGNGGGKYYFNSGGNPYHGYIKRKYQASAPGQGPVNVTGTLAKSIKVLPYKSGAGVAIRDVAFYSSALENGSQGGGRFGAKGKIDRRERKRLKVTSRQSEPRPFLSTALEERRASIEQRIGKSFIEGVAFERQKVTRRRSP